ncbi:MAG: hypothetical protein ACU0B7_07445 [Paracoccaceae bacterium]|uniref:hypothetical protein n=1 Tax=Seohaeicola saemankumensis TaxID=481181 RepID=UPI001E4911C3|nr:hypothetical protein [Seohaeicola saemankumensis]MCD1624686.1 hypothetical protein [Seohaeicola saemankumensis]
MRHLTSALLVSTLVLSGCAGVRDSRINPFNWFGRSQVEPVASTEANPLIPRGGTGGLFAASRPADVLPDAPLAAQVGDLSVLRVQGGALIRATAVSDTVGAFNVSLQPVNNGVPVDGVLTYELRAFAPSAGSMPMPERARSHVAAVRVSDADLDGVRVIRVQAERNAATTTRR